MGAAKKDYKNEIRRHVIGIHLYDHEYEKINAIALKEERTLANVVYRALLKTILYSKEKKR